MKQNTIYRVFCPKRNVIFFPVSLSELGMDWNFTEKSRAPLLGPGRYWEEVLLELFFKMAFLKGTKKNKKIEDYL